VLTDIAKFYEGVFQQGIDHVDIKIQSLKPVSDDVVLVQGETRATGKNDKGEPLENNFVWSLVDVREGNQLKVRMLTIMPKAPPPKVADAK
jgi:ketosteroid isomerase-like protein